MLLLRVNRGTEVIDKYFNSIGKRTDILYNCFIKSPDNGGDIKVKEYKKIKLSGLQPHQTHIWINPLNLMSFTKW